MVNTILKLSYLVLFFLTIGFTPSNVKSDIDANYLNILIIFFLLGLAIHIFLLQKETRNWFRLDFLFLVSMSIAFYLVPILYSLYGFFPTFFYYPNIIHYVNYSTWLVNLFILSWLIGFHFFLNNRNKTLIKNQNKINQQNINYKTYLKLSEILFIIFIIIVGKSFFTSSYEGLDNASTLAKYSYMLFSITILLSTFFIFLKYSQLLKNNILNIYKIDKSYFILVLTYLTLFVIVLSDRGSALQLLSAIIFVYAILVKPITFKQISILLIMGTIFMTIVGLGRIDGGDISSGQKKLVEDLSNLKREGSVAYLLTKDLSGTCRILYKSVEYINDGNDFFLGKTMIGPFLGVIPFANGLFHELVSLDRESKYEINTSTFITHLVLGNYPKWGEGSNLLAEIYLNYSIYGIIIIGFFLGILFKKLHNELRELNNIYYIILSLVLIAFVIYWPRSSLFVVLRPIIWAIVIYIIISKIKWRVS